MVTFGFVHTGQVAVAVAVEVAVMVEAGDPPATVVAGAETPPVATVDPPTVEVVVAGLLLPPVAAPVVAVEPPIAKVFVAVAVTVLVLLTTLASPGSVPCGLQPKVSAKAKIGRMVIFMTLAPFPRLTNPKLLFVFMSVGPPLAIVKLFTP